jgi:predicted DNA repair protein MutK
MVIALNEVANQAFVPRLIILIVVALVLTVMVYGVVAVLVKIDDVGLRLTQATSQAGQKVGQGLVAGMPKLLSALSAVGTIAMLWVGGHILLAGSEQLGWRTPERWVRHVEGQARDRLEFVGGLLAWLVDTGISALVGLVVGTAVVALTYLVTLNLGIRRRD